MTSREKLLRKPIYWFDHEQNELFRQVYSYMEKENINQTELANRLKITKGRVSQILNGNFNYTLKKLIDISLAIGLVPRIKYDKLDDIIKLDTQLKSYHNSDSSIVKNKIIPLAVVNKFDNSSGNEQENEKVNINSYTQYKRNDIQDILLEKEKSDSILVA
ncbi:MAG: XRE family transcriptional regulator [Mucilaginibacter sp.]|uniref:helix-turn-helix domain-containing protein n=1 Tax=Mucilaginibacter sp. TaxID=1882438 RepID=UPI0034E60C6F